MRFQTPVSFELYSSEIGWRKGEAHSLDGYAGMIDNIILDCSHDTISSYIEVHYVKLPPMMTPTRNNIHRWYIGGDWAASVNGVEIRGSYTPTLFEKVLAKACEDEERNVL